MTLKIVPLPAYSDNYIWLLINPNQQTAYVIDPGDAAPVISYLQQQQLKLAGILITHHHWDHVTGIEPLLQAMSAHCNIPVYGPHAEIIPCCTHPLHAGDTIFLFNNEFKLNIFELPGHTLGHIGYFYNHPVTPKVFSGDTLFAVGCGRLYEGTASQLFHSLQLLAQLPPETEVYCTHEYTLSNLSFALTVEPNNQALQERQIICQQQRQQGQPTLPTTIALELATNPFLRCKEAEVITTISTKETSINVSDPTAVFAALRQWKDCF